MLKNKYSQNSKLKRFALILVPLLLIGGGLGYALNSSSNEAKNNSSDSQQEAKTTSDQPTAQPDFNDGDENRDPGNTLREDEGTAVVVDSEGEIDESTANNDPVTSESGEISVYAPQPNVVLKSGGTVAGESSLPNVSYRIIDSTTGVIATGNLKVVDGKFSGKLNFETGAKEGRLDIFATRSDGTEFSNVEIPFRFR